MENKPNIEKRMRIISESAKDIYKWCEKKGIDIDTQDENGIRLDSYLTDIILCSDLKSSQPELWEG